MTFAGSAASRRQFPKDGLPEVAFLGRSNVGKSSLLNALAGVDGLARVSRQPGRTRLVNFFRYGNELYLTDLPGYGYAQVSEGIRKGWEALVRAYLEGRPSLALCVLLVDARRGAMADDLLLRDYLEGQDLPYLVAATKTDTLPKRELGPAREALERGLGPVLQVSSVTGLGMKELWARIRAALQKPRGGEKNDGR